MSVTPDFIGQIYKDTNTGNLWRANSLTPGDWTLEAGRFLIETVASGHDQDAGIYILSDLAGVTVFRWNGVETFGGFDLESNNLLQAQFPHLTTIHTGHPFTIYSSSITTISAPLVSSISALDFSFCPNLSSVDLHSLATTDNTIDLDNDPLLTQLDFSALVTIGAGSLLCNDCTGLTSVICPVFLPRNGMAINFSNCALDVTSVDLLLARGVANAAFVSGGINVSGGTNAPPSSVAPGSDYDILTVRGVTVLKN